MSAPPRLLVVAHPRAEAIGALVEHLVTGITEGGGIADVREPTAAGPAEVEAAAAVVIAGPEYFGYMSGLVKDFLERIYPWTLETGIVRPCGLVVSAGNDGTGAITSIERILTGLRWSQPLPALLARMPIDDTDLAAAHELGATLAAGLEAGIFG